MSDDAPTTDDGGTLGSLLGKIASTRRSPALAPGTLVGGQYEIEKAIGEGGMGVVYLARDRRLERAVALKVGIAMSAEALAQIEREARTVAKLAHPNVVVVYQVGTIDERVFIAMEYVPGTARAWLAEKPRSWREIVSLYAAVGEGLAAAHEAGLVHRDFKPENVLVGADGRPRISDFGVAIAGDASSGDVVGTLAYMPPEQLAGTSVDARADQFAFAVSLWEALFGARPTADPAPPAENARAAPRSVIASLRRALAGTAPERWPTMHALVAALRASLDQRRNRILFASAATLVLGVGGAVAAMQVTKGDARPSCDTGAAEIGSVWTPARRATLARDASLVAYVDRFAASWATTHDAACAATHVDRTASPALLERRMLCLATVKADVAASVSLAARSREAAAELVPYLQERPSPASCLDTAELDQEEPPPPGARASLDVAIAALAEARAAELVPDREEQLAKTEAAIRAARATGWRPLIARALEERGQTLRQHNRSKEAVELFEESARLALAARADLTAFYAYTEGAWALSLEGRLPEADQLSATAFSLWERLGKPPGLGWKIYGTIGQIAHSRGQMKEALAAVRQQLEMARMADADPQKIAQTEHDHALMLLEMGDLKAATAAATTALRLDVETLGAEHPFVGKAHLLLGQISLRGGKLDDAATHASAAMALLERWYGPFEPRLVNGLIILSQVDAAHGKLDDARSKIERAVDIQRRGDANSPQVANLEQSLAINALSRGDLVEARRRADAALAAAEKRLGPDHVDLIDMLAVVAAIAREGTSPDLEGSDRLLARAQRIAAAVLPDGHRRVVNLAIERSYTQVKANQARAAVDALAPYVARLDKLDLGVLTPNELRFALAQAHAALGELPRACALAKDAHAGYLEAKARPAKEVEAWRAKNCRG